MKHLTDDQIYDLAEKIFNEEDFSDEDKAALYHVVDCTECYNMLVCTLAMIDVTSDFSSLVAKPVILSDELIESIEC